ncbi:MAG: hypothetical protein ABH879_09310 [archaeon]
MPKAEISIPVLVAALLALTVLIILFFMFSGKSDDLFRGKATSCSLKGGVCNTEVAGWDVPNQCHPDYVPVENTDCNFDGVEGNDLCCIPMK